ncbi:chemotaxis protein CheA [Rhodocyclus tenuis]|uniref:chemotaxis protein CheA n=1 Tax=Rhodocyclus tenuis TaxID=1066 RepID=UPI001908E493|nr:chemotaxis protein CheA [Rhodocyclus tenuis]MBK1679767.1 chemotaxis protein CheA [Rhodocyclus tenuis]
MSPLLEQFLSEARDFLQGIGEKLMQLENAPDDVELMTELFRFVHTLKGNSGLFDFPEMTRVLHAGEDLMDAVRNGRVAYSQQLADRLLDAMDFVGMLCDEIEAEGSIGAAYAADSARLAESLRQLMASAEKAGAVSAIEEAATPLVLTAAAATAPLLAPKVELPLAEIPETARMAAYRSARAGNPLHWLSYSPAEECFFNGDDPFFQARQTPGVVWGGIVARAPWPPLAAMDAYRCLLDFRLLTTAPRAELDEYYRYMPEQIKLLPVSPLALVLPQGDPNGGPVYEDLVVDALRNLRGGDVSAVARAARAMLELSNPDLWLSSALRWLLLLIECEPDNHPALAALIESLRSLQPVDWYLLEQSATPAVGAGTTAGATEAAAGTASPLAAEEAAALAAIVAAQRAILTLPLEAPWQLGRLRAAGAALAGCLRASGRGEAVHEVETATAQSLACGSAQPLSDWLAHHFAPAAESAAAANHPSASVVATAAARPVATASGGANTAADGDRESSSGRRADDADSDVKFGRRAEDAAAAGVKSVKVDQAKIDRLMNLIGEIVVAKNALPYLAGRAETVFGVRELAREIKAQYAVINRIAEEMQDGIMQIRMMPVSFVFQRFPRLVRDISRKLGKEVNLVLEGEDTEADKNIIEALGDPLVHIVRNSLDHGFELPELRRAAGKPPAGTLTIRATQESDRVVIEIVDDGKGIDPAVIKRKAYEKGLIDETALERISDQEAVNLVFAAGFSTAEVVSDLSGRGVGMDVVRTAIEKVNGAISLESEKGKGTRLRLSLPLSMAVTNVMIVESDAQIFGVPMDCVVETVRVPRADIRTIKKSLTTVLRGRIIPLKSTNALLGLAAPPLANAEDELAVLVVRLGDESVGLLVDDFRETVDIILKPMAGVLAGLPAYSGSALMGDGSVLMVLNIKGLF